MSIYQILIDLFICLFIYEFVPYLDDILFELLIGLFLFVDIGLLLAFLY